MPENYKIRKFVRLARMDGQQCNVHYCSRACQGRGKPSQRKSFSPYFPDSQTALDAEDPDVEFAATCRQGIKIFVFKGADRCTSTVAYVRSDWSVLCGYCRDNI